MSSFVLSGLSMRKAQSSRYTWHAEGSLRQPTSIALEQRRLLTGPCVKRSGEWHHQTAEPGLLDDMSYMPRREVQSLGTVGAQFRPCCSQLMEVRRRGGLIAKGDTFAEARQSSSGNTAPLGIPCPRSADHHLLVKSRLSAEQAQIGMQSILHSYYEGRTAEYHMPDFHEWTLPAEPLVWLLQAANLGGVPFVSPHPVLAWLHKSMICCGPLQIARQLHVGSRTWESVRGLGPRSLSTVQS